ncbi:protein jag [Patescibacteria group bacterium]
MDKKEEFIKNIIEDFLSKLTVSFDSVDVVKNESFGSVKFVIRTNESGILIGNDGVNIKALNHILKKIIWKKMSSEFGNDVRLDFFVDINDYQEQAINKIKEEAEKAVQEVDLLKRDVELRPMSAYERMIAHSILAEKPNIKTDSVGEGLERRVVVKYINTSL